MAKTTEKQLTAEELAAKAEADRIAAEEAAKAEADGIAAEEAAKAEADRIAAEEAAKAEADGIAAEEAAKAENELDRKTATLGKIAEEYSKHYPSCKAFHITSDRLVFLEDDLPAARGHAQTLKDTKVHTVKIK